MQWSGSSPQKILFIMSFTAVLFGCVNAAREIVKEAPIYQRERAVGLRILPYMFSKIVVLALLCLVQSTILVMIVDLVDPLYQGVFLPALAEVYITMTFTALAGLMTGLTISVIAPSTDRAMSFVPIILIPQVIFSGIVFPLNNEAIQILSMAFTTRWSIAALGTTIGLHSDKMGGDNLLRGYSPYHGIIFSTYSQADAVRHLLIMWAVLSAMIILLACVVGIFLKRKDARA